MFNTFLNYSIERNRRRAAIKKAGGGFNYSGMLEDAQKERHRLSLYPPACSSVIRYVQKPVYEETHGEFLFRSVDVEQKLEEILQESPHLINVDEGSILNWVRGSAASLTEATNVPPIWSRFQYLANNLVRAGKADIFCRKCQAVIAQKHLVMDDDCGKRGWNYNRVVCPHGHNLLVVESLHLLLK